MHGWQNASYIIDNPKGVFNSQPLSYDDGETKINTSEVDL